ncbi:General secretion pathway protein D [plant metagenome]|uniref:General secretion pathway protein D n=1 Tax=plant metagenome TaxID=1297885 RepID=A0A484PI40_9ZZZZ
MMPMRAPHLSRSLQPAPRRAPLALALASALLLLAGCATDKQQRPAPMTLPDSPLVRATTDGGTPATVSGVSGAPVRMQEAPRQRDLGPLRVRNEPARAVAAAEAAGAQDSGERVTLNFVEADLPAVVRALARFTGRNFIVDPRVKGQLTLVSEAPVTARTAYDMLVAALRMQGFAIAESDGISRVVPEADAKLLGGVVTDGSGGPTGSGGLVTRVFALQYENAANLVPVLRPMIAPSNPINAYPNNNTLVVTDYADNMARIAQVIAGIDTPASLNADIIPVNHGVASDIAVLVGQLLDAPQGAAGNDASQRVTVIADPRSNSVLVRASSPARAQLARELVRRMDSPNTRPGNLHVVYLRNAQAVKLAEVLRGTLTGQSGNQTGGESSLSSGSNSAGGAFGGNNRNTGTNNSSTARNGMSGAFGDSTTSGAMGSSGQLGGGNTTQSVAFSAGGATVQADPTTNTLIISAPEPLYRSLREVIDQLDQRRAQVLVETLIVEISSENAAEFGIQWMTGGGGLDGNGTSFIGGANFGGTGLNPNAGTTIDALGAGLSLGVVRGTVNVLGQQIVNLGVLATALQRVSGTNILSTPNLLTLDNEQASIIVGRTVPFVTGSYVTNSGDGAGNPFQTIEREDVGLTLRLRPQISEGGTVKLDLYQEVSSIDEAVQSTAGIITRKRALETSVLVDNGQIIVLGGLLEDTSSDSTQSVPLLGDLPLIGSLFRYDRRQRSKTNLMIFLRPHIVRSAQDSSRVSLDRYDYMRRLQDNARPESHFALPDTDSPQLPALDDKGQPVSLDLRPENVDDTLRHGTPPATAETVERHAAPVQPPVPAAPAGGPPRIASTAAEDVPQDGPARVLEVANAATPEEAQRIVKRIRATGLNAYTQVAPGGTGTLVRTRVANNESVQAAQALLRGLGYNAQPL